jgi:hypothetical protein
MKPWLWKFFQYICKCQEERSEEATPHAMNNQRLATPTPGTLQPESEDPAGPGRPAGEEIARQRPETQTTGESNTEDFANQWKIASKVLDSVFFIIFLLVYFILIIWFHSA